MINLTNSLTPSPLLHLVPTDPGSTWMKDADPAIDTPPDTDSDPLPEACWPREAARSGLFGTVSPRVLALPGGYRMYYSQISPRPGSPAGANDYDNSATRILSAFSTDGSQWRPEPGVRLSPREGGAGDYRVVSSEVVPAFDGKHLRMYYECCRGPQSMQNAIRSALSEDGLSWRMEPGVRLESSGGNLASPRIVFLSDGSCRLYCMERGLGIISARADDGLAFDREPGLRIAQGGAYDALTAFAPEIVHVHGGGYVMYFAGYSASNRAHILRAESADGLTWRKQPTPAISPGGRWDAVKCSEMCLYTLPRGPGAEPIYRMAYEACDGTAVNERGVWRIAGATAIA